MLGTDGDTGTTGACDLPGFRNKAKKELSAEGNLLPFLPEVLTVGGLPFGAGSLLSVLRLLPPLGPTLQVMKEKGKRSSRITHRIKVDASCTLQNHTMFREGFRVNVTDIDHTDLKTDVQIKAARHVHCLIDCHSYPEATEMIFNMGT